MGRVLLEFGKRPRKAGENINCAYWRVLRQADRLRRLAAFCGGVGKCQLWTSSARITSLGHMNEGRDFKRGRESDLLERIDRLESAIEQIRSRNDRVELDKAWETSLYRRPWITILTYIVTAIVFLLIGAPYFYLSALIPTVGYVLSTLTLPIVKTHWSNKYGEP